MSEELRDFLLYVLFWLVASQFIAHYLNKAFNGGRKNDRY